MSALAYIIIGGFEALIFWKMLIDSKVIDDIEVKIILGLFAILTSAATIILIIDLIRKII
jgi:hypothetical protein